MTQWYDFFSGIANEAVIKVIVEVILALLGVLGGWLLYRLKTVGDRLRPTHRVLVFVSSGGTCRDPMAKAITDQLLAHLELKHPVDVHAIGLALGDSTEASWGARQAIKELYGSDLLKDHKPTADSAALIRRAKIILVMDRGLLESSKKRLPPEKTYLLKEFFGLTGDVVDPFSRVGQRSPETLERYKRCATELREILSGHLDVLLKALDAV
jgi:protein-tyrosine-phosphatase